MNGQINLVIALLICVVALALVNVPSPMQAEASYSAQHPFQNPDLPIEQRIDNILSLMTIDEKIECLDTNPSVPRLGIKGSGHVEGIHGLTQGGPGKWGRPLTIPTTTFPQGIGLGETWDTELLRQAGEVEGYEARYVLQSPKYNQGGIVIRSPNADLGGIHAGAELKSATAKTRTSMARWSLPLPKACKVIIPNTGNPLP